MWCTDDLSHTFPQFLLGILSSCVWLSLFMLLASRGTVLHVLCSPPSSGFSPTNGVSISSSRPQVANVLAVSRVMFAIFSNSNFPLFFEYFCNKSFLLAVLSHFGDRFDVIKFIGSTTRVGNELPFLDRIRRFPIFRHLRKIQYTTMFMYNLDMR